MMFQKISLVCICILISFSASHATTNIPDLSLSVAYMSEVTTEEVVLFIVPDGSGSAFPQGQVMGAGTLIDATIKLELMDPYGVTISDFPAEDMWLEALDGGMIPCIGGTIADSNTDTYGKTSWVHPLLGGGSSTSGCLVFISGMALTQAPLPLNFNSPDMNGDGTVDLLDVGLLATAFFGDYDFSADFFADGVVNIADVTRFAQSMGASCP